MAIKFLDFYQWWLSPDHSFWAKSRYPHGYCRYYPTCSEYARRAILRQGLWRGALRSLWRVLRCNPWAKGGIDDIA